MDSHDVSLLIVGGGLALVVLWFASQSSGGLPVPQVQTEAQFQGLGTSLDASVAAGSPLDMSPEFHFYVGSYNGPNDMLVPPRHRYPLVCGGNISTLIHKGFDGLRKGSPDNEWRINPPAEANL